MSSAKKTKHAEPFDTSRGLNPALKKLIEGYQDYLHELEPKEDVPKIHVDEIAAKFAAFYEKVRGFIDYKEEHLLRKNFIDRVFRRRFFFKDFSGNIGEGIIKEIIRSGRLPNDSVPETKIAEIDHIIHNFVETLRELKRLGTKREAELEDWLTRLVINSIEESLFPPLKENLISDTMFFSLKEKLSISGSSLSENDINLQLFIAVQRSLLRVDEDQLNYRLLKFIRPDWNSLSNGEMRDFVQDLPNLKDSIEAHLKHPLRKYFSKLCQRYNTIFYLFGDIIDKRKTSEEFASTFENIDELEHDIAEAYQSRYARERSRLNRLAFLSVLSIFLSKILVAIAVEYPIDSGFMGRVGNGLAEAFDLNVQFSTEDVSSWLNTLINIIFPAVLMLIIVLSIRMPSEENEELVQNTVKNICYGDDKKGFGIIVPKKKNLLTRLIINSLYGVIFISVFYQLIKFLHDVLNFSPANIAIFAFFTSLVAATGVKVHNRAKDISMEEREPKVTGFIIDIFALPFITVGKWGLATLNKLNILVVIFNLIIELPFQIFVQFIENFRSFIKSKKDELN